MPRVHFLAVPRRSHATAVVVTIIALLALLVWLLGVQPAHAQSPDGESASPRISDVGIPAGRWQMGAFIDVDYAKDLNSPSNHVFRSRGTTPRVDEPDVNMAGAYLRKKAADSSRWGVEVTGQGGQDSQTFGFSATAPNITGADALRHLGPTNVSYLAPLGNGLALQGGVFGSLVGYDSLYAKDNLTYTRPWAADFTPYLMLGVNGSYPLSEKLTVAGVLVNGYWHLAHANDVPSVGAQVAYKTTATTSVRQTVLYGPHQSNTSLDLWRLLSDTIVERKTDRSTTAIEFQVSTERVDAATAPRALWLAAQAPVHWIISGPLSVTLRPEFAWDRDGRWTGFPQSVTALTSTVEYRIGVRETQAVVRVEHRYDNSTGSGGGFFKDIQSGAVALVPGQHLLLIALIVTVDRSFER